MTSTRISRSSTPPGAWEAAATRPLTAMTLSTPATVARIGSSSASCSTTAWTTPQPSRTTRKLTPPRRRSECSQPATRTVSPMWLATSGVRMRALGTVVTVVSMGMLRS